MVFFLPQTQWWQLKLLRENKMHDQRLKNSTRVYFVPSEFCLMGIKLDAFLWFSRTVFTLCVFSTINKNVLLTDWTLSHYRTQWPAGQAETSGEVWTGGKFVCHLTKKRRAPHQPERPKDSTAGKHCSSRASSPETTRTSGKRNLICKRRGMFSSALQTR